MSELSGRSKATQHEETYEDEVPTPLVISRVHADRRRNNEPFWDPIKIKVEETLALIIKSPKMEPKGRSFNHERFMVTRNPNAIMNFQTSACLDFGQEAWLGMSKAIRLPFLTERAKREIDAIQRSESSYVEHEDIGGESYFGYLDFQSNRREEQEQVWEQATPIHPMMLAPYRLPPKQVIARDFIGKRIKPRNLGVVREPFHIEKDTYVSLLENELMGAETVNRMNEAETNTTLDTLNSKLNPRKQMFHYATPRVAEGECESYEPEYDDFQFSFPGYNSFLNKCRLSKASEKYIASPSNKHAPLRRSIPMTPYKVLDAPDLVDDFYLNLVDWSSSNMLAVGLNQRVYLWNAGTSVVTRLCEVENDYVTSISWSKWGDGDRLLAIGTRNGNLQVWDALKQKRISIYSNSGSTTGSQRIGVLSWNDWVVCSGSRDRTVVLRDFRCTPPDNDNPRNKNRKEYSLQLTGHVQEVCGMKWSLSKDLLATGGNDNRVIVRSLRYLKDPIFNFDGHIAAVKALDWSPHQPYLLCSGGGTADRSLRFWNILTGELVHHIDTGSQVCNITWSRFANEFATTHGYSKNHIIVWRYPSLYQLTKLHGHTFRVLYMAKSPDGRSIVTGAGDETLRFWHVFAEQSKKENPYRETFVNSLMDIASQPSKYTAPYGSQSMEYEKYYTKFETDRILHPSLSRSLRYRNRFESGNPITNGVFPIVR